MLGPVTSSSLKHVITLRASWRRTCWDVQVLVVVNALTMRWAVEGEADFKNEMWKNVPYRQSALAESTVSWCKSCNSVLILAWTSHELIIKKNHFICAYVSVFQSLALEWINTHASHRSQFISRASGFFWRVLLATGGGMRYLTISVQGLRCALSLLNVPHHRGSMWISTYPPNTRYWLAVETLDQLKFYRLKLMVSYSVIYFCCCILLLRT